ncbi:hypothetical protein RB653_010442 [Dictyostelium firmibasis]|uniref:Uncharacterized protein n=1 Tax=Dictyostelium firmibasis TaxID=79012 RepID=A0AAN7TSC8_9MYCE
MNKSILNIIIFLIFFTKNIYSQNFKGNQKAQVNALFSQIYQGHVYEGSQCIIGLIVCNGDTVTEINIFTGVQVTLTVDFSVFEDLNYFSSRSNINFLPNIFSRLPNFTSLAHMSLDDLTVPIPDNISLPENLQYVSFQRISVPLPSAFFSTGKIQNLNIYSTGPGFAFPSELPNNYYLRVLRATLDENGLFPYNAGSSLKNLSSLTLYINNKGTHNITFPKFQPFTKLENLEIFFQGLDPSSQLFGFEPSLNKITSLNTLEIRNYGFNYSMDAVDLSNLTNSLSLSFIYYVDNLKVFKFPVGCSLILNYINASIYEADFKNLSRLHIVNDKFLDNLPPASNFDTGSMSFLHLSGNKFIGSLPEEYCSFKKNVIFIGNNNLTGNVPDCFRCLGGDQFKDFFPNNFDNFDVSTPPDVCTAFSLSVPVNQFLKTNETTTLEFSGSNIGWDSEIQSSQNNVSLEITTPNKNIKITIPPGAGIQDATLKFGVNFSINVTLQYEFFGPSIDSYYVNGSNIFFKGSYFSYNPSYNNIFTINGNNTFIANIQTLEEDTLNHGLGFPSGQDENPVSILKNCEYFNVSIDVAGKQSSTVSLLYFGNITVSNVSSLILNTTGGEITINGEFGCKTTDFSETIFKINNVDVEIKQISESQVNITYPPIENAGTYPFYIIVGDFKYNSEIQYIITPTFPPTQTPNPTPTPTPTPTDGENPSTSSTLSISLVYLFSLFLSIYFIF